VLFDEADRTRARGSRVARVRVRRRAGANRFEPIGASGSSSSVHRVVAAVERIVEQFPTSEGSALLGTHAAVALDHVEQALPSVARDRGLCLHERQSSRLKVPCQFSAGENVRASGWSERDREGAKGLSLMDRSGEKNSGVPWKEEDCGSNCRRAKELNLRTASEKRFRGMQHPAEGNGTLEAFP